MFSAITKNFRKFSGYEYLSVYEIFFLGPKSIPVVAPIWCDRNAEHKPMWQTSYVIGTKLVSVI
jgi:hypothetical protein